MEPLKTFRSDVSDALRRVVSQATPSLAWMSQCVGLIRAINERFGRLIRQIDHPMSRWKGACVEEYMSYTLSLLDHLNLITSSLSHLSQARLRLSHALNLVDLGQSSTSLQHLKHIQPSPAVMTNRGERSKPRDDGSKERIVHHAIHDLQNMGSWVCGVVLSGLSGNSKLPYLESRRWIHDPQSLASALGILVRDVGRVNDAATRLEATLTNGEGCAIAAEALRTELISLQREKDKLIKEVDGAFAVVMDSRNQLLSNTFSL